MTFRPTTEHRTESRVVALMRAAIMDTFGPNAQGHYPVGAFFGKVDSPHWIPVDDIWYRPWPDAATVRRSAPNDDVVDAFRASIGTGAAVRLANGRVVDWEAVPATSAHRLPPAR